jgi:hypothetical protein
VLERLKREQGIGYELGEMMKEGTETSCLQRHFIIFFAPGVKETEKGQNLG